MVVRRTSEVSENAREKVIPILIRSNLKFTRCPGTNFQKSGALLAGSICRGIRGMNDIVQVASRYPLTTLLLAARLNLACSPVVLTKHYVT
jgi:hypothetical protein